MAWQAPFPIRFELRYSLDEAVRYSDLRSRYQASLVDGQRSWTRLTVFTCLASGLAFLALAAGALAKGGLPLVAVLLGAAFICGMYAAWMESSSTSHRIVKALHDQGKCFGPWNVTITENSLEATADGYSSRLELAAIRNVTFDDSFVVLMIDPTLDFFILKRCFGDDRAAEEFKSFIEARRGRSDHSQCTRHHPGETVSDPLGLAIASPVRDDEVRRFLPLPRIGDFTAPPSRPMSPYRT